MPAYRDSVRTRRQASWTERQRDVLESFPLFHACERLGRNKDDIIDNRLTYLDEFAEIASDVVGVSTRPIR